MVAETHMNSIPNFIPFFNVLRRYHRHKVVGLENIPRLGGALVVPNHSFATYDVLLIGSVVFETYHRVIRGLADRLAFRTPGVRTFLKNIGMVEASNENAARLLAQGDLLGIPPGGMREAIRGHRDRYKINWEGRKGVVRLAIAAQVPIVLAACPRADDLYTVHAGKLSDIAYKRFKLPAVFPVGLAGTLLPRPVQLTHFLSEPISPPEKIEPRSPHYDETVTAFHRHLIERMEALMGHALRESQDFAATNGKMT